MGWEIERQVISNDQDLLNFRLKMIENLQKELAEAGKVCTRLNSENARLREEKEQLQDQCSQLLDKQYQDDYTVNNRKKIIENLKKTIERYEDENKAFRALVRLWV